MTNWRFYNYEEYREGIEEEEIVSLLHGYSMKLYSKRHANKKKIEIESHDQEIEIL